MIRMSVGLVVLTGVLLLTGVLPALAAEDSAPATSGELSADEAARELANPNTPLASLTLKMQWRHFEGNLPGADEQNSGTFLFQPSFPFPITPTDSIFFRPAIPLLVEQPVGVNARTGRIRTESGFGDIGFDLAWGHTAKSGWLTAFGLVSTLPTGQDDLSNDTWSLGPEAFVGLFKKWGIVGVFPNHQWDVTGDNEVNLTTIQPFMIFLPGNGWSVGTAGILTYDWEQDQWTVPIQLQIAKTLKIGKTPWKFGIELNYYAVRNSTLAPEAMIGFNVTPVVKNVVAEWLGLGTK